MKNVCQVLIGRTLLKVCLFCSLSSILGDGDPDETVDDFSGSFTPYKKFKETNAKKKSLKTKLQNIKLTAEAGWYSSAFEGGGEWVVGGQLVFFVVKGKEETLQN